MARLSIADFPPEQVAGWITVSERKAQTDEAIDPDAARANETDERQWFVAYANPRREMDAARTLTRRAFATYVPMKRVSRTLTRRRVTAEAPLLPRYVFVGLGSGQTLYGLRDTPGLEGVVRMAGVPVTVPPAIIAGLRTEEGAGVYDYSDEAADAKAEAAAAEIYLPGVPVRVKAGPFMSFRGVVEGLLPKGRVSVFITIFTKSFSVPMPLAHVEVW